MRLTDEEKKEMLEDAKNEQRKNNFRFGKEKNGSITFEEYVSNLYQLQKCYNIKTKKEYLEYKNIRI